jgi:phosphatidylglycerophosphate synthase
LKPWAYILTLSRPVLAAGFAACAYRACIGAPAAGGPIALPWLAALLMLAGGAELTDLFDGMVARRCGVASRLGGLLDPMLD